MSRKPASQQFVVVIAATALLAAMYSVTRAPVALQPVTSEQLWAAAILQPFSSDDSTRGDEALRLYSQAIERSASPSAIYVSLGDYLRGPFPLAIDLRRFANGEAELYEDDGDIAAYKAALRVAPDDPLPHFRMAVYAEGDVALQSARWLSKNQPKNALGPYLEAAHAVVHEPDAVLRHVCEGNSRSTLHVYDDPVPQRVDVSYPNHFEYETLAGKRVPPSALRLIVHRQNTFFDFANPLHESLEAVLDYLMTVAGDAGNADSTAAILAHHRCCHKLIFNSAGNMGISFIGVFRYDESYEVAQERLPVGAIDFNRTAKEHDEMDRFRQLIKKQWEPRYAIIQKTSFEAALCGPVDPVMAEIRLVKQIQSMAMDP